MMVVDGVLFPGKCQIVVVVVFLDYIWCKSFFSALSSHLPPFLRFVSSKYHLLWGALLTNALPSTHKIRTPFSTYFLLHLFDEIWIPKKMVNMYSTI